jgi:hypothetical protein
MNWYTCRFVDDYHVVVFVYYTDWKSRYRRFVTMKGMGNNIAILDNMTRRRDLFSVYDYSTAFDCIFLKLLAYGTLVSF